MGTKYFFIYVLMLIPGFIFSNVQRYERNISWNGIQEIKISDNESIPLLRFDGSINEPGNNFFPVYFERIPIDYIASDLKIELYNKIFEPVPDEEIFAIDGVEIITQEIAITSYISFERKKPFATLSFIPIRKNEITGLYERLISFEIEISFSQEGQSPYKSSSYKENSVLASGNWYKVSVTNTGIHKISYQELSDMGIDVNNINPKNIRIYGNGGGMLPENPTIPRYDDLQENAIYVAGENDGSFDADDYILFYGQSPNVWKFDESLDKSIHLYSDYNYYFITVDLGEGKRVESQPSSGLNPTFTSKQFNYGYHHEFDQRNLIGSGRIWYGEKFDLETELVEEINFANLDIGSEVYFEADVAAKSESSSSFSFFINNQNILNLSISATNSSNVNSDFAKTKFGSTSFIANSPNLTVKIVYNKPLSTSVGWLNYFKLNVIRHLSFSGGQMAFRDLRTANQDLVTEYTLSNTNSNVTVWNVTDLINVKKIEATNQNGKLVFRVESNELEEFIAFNGSSYYSASFTGKVKNQNLHGLGEYEMIIITHPSFKNEALRLADFHKNLDNMSVVVVELQDIYNEFSSGAQDISAIRDFVKMLYDRASSGNEPKYLLLFGDGSYDNKNRVENNTNYIPTWESTESLNPVSSYVMDDFYGLLDGDNTVDIGIGRFVVSSENQAVSAVDKVIHYATNSSKVMNDWRNIACLIADDEDSNLHFNDAEKLAVMIDTMNKNINIDKIYLDSYEQISTPGGERYPEVTQDITNRVERGALFVNYVGHGGEGGLAHERILTIADINSWKNYDNMPVFITATCEFSRFDDPHRTSAGELIFLNKNGAGISLYTTTRATYAGGNAALNRNFYRYSLARDNGKYNRMGDVIRLAKNATGSSENTKKFVLLGDPALHFAFPEHNVITLKINDISVEELTDTIKALSEVTISGEMQDYYGNKLSNFNGELFPTVFDKPAKYTTLGNDPASNPANFEIQKNALYKGKATISNGNWNFTFIAPKDIAYQYGFGKLSYYARNENIDGAGYYLDVVVGGYNENSGIDLKGPDIELYMCDTYFRNEGITDENPSLLAFVEDESGINTVGSGIGHNIIATLDDTKEFVLDNYYKADLDNYKKGEITYPFFDLSDGSHTLTLKVWDIYNNSSTAHIEFIVNGLPEGYNYPNPFRGTTQFKFEHTYCDKPLDVKIQIYNISGQLVKTISDNYNDDCYVYISDSWDGTNDSGNKLTGGIYIYRIFVNSVDGESLFNITNKLVIFD